MAFYGHQLFDWSRQSQWPDSAQEQEKENQTRIQSSQPGDNDAQISSTIDNQLITVKPLDLSSTNESIEVSGWVGTEFGQSIAGETVVLFSPSQKTYFSIVTDISGEFKFIDIKPGWDYVFKVTPKGMFQSYTQSYIKLKSDEEVHDIILESIPVGILNGRIVDPYDRPVTDIEISITTVEKIYGSTQVVTDANGGFSVSDFPKGRFQLAINGPQNIRASGLKFDPDNAVPFNLTIDLGSYHLEGRIFDESGLAVDGADVFLNWALNENGVRTRSTRKVSANKAGEFRFTGLGPGDHKLIVSAWIGDTFKQTVKKTVNVGVDSGEIMIFLDTQQN